MQDLTHKAAIFISALFSFMSKEAQTQVTPWRNSGVLSSVLWRMAEESMLPEWFKEYLLSGGYDPLYRSLPALDDAIVHAVRCLLLECDGTQFHLHVPCGRGIYMQLLQQEGLHVDQTRALAAALEKRFIEREERDRKMMESPA